jgi:hypothetical protein
MKKIIIIFLMCFILLVSCDSNKGTCKVNYSIIYPDTTIIYDTIFNYEYYDDMYRPCASSYKGTNYIKLGYYEFSHTTCPIRINSYKILTKNADE